MKIAVVSCWFINNYGSILQSFATERYFADKGFTCHTISVKGLKPYLNSQKKKYYLKNIYKFSLLSSKYPQAKLAFLRKVIPSERDAFKKRVYKMNDFRKRFSFVGENAKTLEDMHLLSRDYDLILLGGDQLLRPDNIFPSYYTLEWVDDSVKRVSLATSFGVSKLDKFSAEKARKFLSKFSYISTREDTGCCIVKDLTGKNAVKACDPVFLLSADSWSEISDDSYCPEGEYIFSYFLGNKKWHRKYLKKLSKKTGLPIVNIPCLDSYLPLDKRVDFPRYDASPEQFLGLIKNAKYICTDSFHVTAFSVMFNRDFFVFKRHSGKKHATNGRLESFLKTVGLENRCVNSSDDVLSLEGVDYTDVSERLKDLIKNTEDFIESW